MLGALAVAVPSSASASCDHTDADADADQNDGWGWDADAQHYRLQQYILDLDVSDNQLTGMQDSRKWQEEQMQREQEEQIRQDGPFGLPAADRDGVPNAQNDYPNDKSRHDFNDCDGHPRSW